MKQLILYLLLPLSIWANNKPEYAVTRIPADLLENANAVIRSHTTEFDVEAPGVAILRECMVVTRFSEKAAYDDLHVGYSNYIKVNSLSANVYDATGKLIRKIKKADIEDMSATGGSTMAQDYRTKYIDFSYGNYPYTIRHYAQRFHHKK